MPGTLTYPVISADSHITDPPNTYLDHIDAAWKDKAPRMVDGGEGVGDVFFVDGMNRPVPMGLVAAAVFAAAGIAPSEVDVAQVQDTESGAELMHMAETGLCEHGEQEELVASGATAIEGRLPVNTDGGCLANGEPIGASGLRQVYENVLQLRGDAGARQVPGDPQVAYTHVYGAPGISGVTILSR